MSLLSPPSISLLLEDTVRKRSRLARVRVHVCVCVPQIGGDKTLKVRF